MSFLEEKENDDLINRIKYCVGYCEDMRKIKPPLSFIPGGPLDSSKLDKSNKNYWTVCTKRQYRVVESYRKSALKKYNSGHCYCLDLLKMIDYRKIIHVKMAYKKSVIKKRNKGNILGSVVL